MNQISQHRRPLARYTGLNTRLDFESQLFTHALDRYAELTGKDALGSVLVLCGMTIDAAILVRYPFQEIVITGLGDQHEAIAAAAGHDPRVRYQEENAESLTFDERTFDLVFCKFGLHHLARPYLGVYEMLRCCRQAAIFIEPCDTLARRWLEALRLTSVYERRKRNPGLRDNYVFPFARHSLEHVLNAYYLDSNYRLELHYGWYSSRFSWQARAPLRKVASYLGWLAQYLPGAQGNILTTVICPGENLPRPVFQLGAEHAVHDLNIQA